MRISILLLVLGIKASALVIDAPGYYCGRTFTEKVSVTCAGVSFDHCIFWDPSVDLEIGPQASVSLNECKFYGLAWSTEGIVATCAAGLYAYHCSFWGLADSVWFDSQFWGEPAVLLWCCAFEHQHSSGHPQVTLMRCKSSSLSVQWCDFVNTVGVDWAADQINLYQTQYADIHDNYIQGDDIPGSNGIVTDDPWADPPSPLHGQTPWFDWTTAYNRIYDNILVGASIGVWAGHDNDVYNNYVVNSGKNVFGYWSAEQKTGIGRYNSEGETWARSNLIHGNTSGALIPSGRYDYCDQVNGNWNANSSIAGEITNHTELQVYNSRRQPVLSRMGLTIGTNW